MATTRDILDAAPYAMGRLLEAAPVKLGASLLVAAGGWLTSPGLYQAAVWMLLADWVTGFSKAIATGKPIQSDPMVRGGVKSLLYFALLGCAWLMTVAGPISDLAGQGIALYVLMTEAISNLENLEAIARHKRIDMPALTMALDFLKMKRSEIQQQGTAPLVPPTQQPTQNGGPYAD